MTHEHADMRWRSAAVGEVLELRDEALAAQPTEHVELDAVSRRVLSDDVVAERDRPSRSHATMDGFAFDATDEYPLSVAHR